MTSKEVIEKEMQAVRDAFNSFPVGKRTESQWKAPEGYILEKLDVKGVPVEHLYPKGKKKGKVIYQIHGGGFLYAYLDVYRDMAVTYSKLAGDAEVYSIDYDVLPEHKFPDALNECVDVYKWLLEQNISSKNIILIGDSAGGNMVLTTTLKARDYKLPMPKAVVALSPWGNIGLDFPSRETNRMNDLILGDAAGQASDLVYKTMYTGQENYKNPFVSPAYADYHGFCDLMIIVGTYEVLYDDSKKIAEAAKRANVKCKLYEYEGMSHDFPIFLPRIDESENARTKIKKFLEHEFQ